MTHRSAPPARVRPRWGRLAAAGSALVVTLLAMVGGLGLLPVDGPTAYADSGHTGPATGPVAELSGLVTAPRSSASASTRARPSGTPTATPSSRPSTPPARSGPTSTPTTPALPAGSGSGRRVVFDISAQRVWLVGPTGRVQRSYLVSGSLTDNLKPGTYAVFSRSRHAIGIDDSGTMQLFVRFTHGQHAAIGFHSIPVLHGRSVQTRAQLGTPTSHGCIRQAWSDALAMWHFAPLGTTVVVTG